MLRERGGGAEEEELGREENWDVGCSAVQSCRETVSSVVAKGQGLGGASGVTSLLRIKLPRNPCFGCDVDFHYLNRVWKDQNSRL
jgi:hypothetical protein